MLTEKNRQVLLVFDARFQDLCGYLLNFAGQVENLFAGEEVHDGLFVIKVPLKGNKYEPYM